MFQGHLELYKNKNNSIYFETPEIIYAKINQGINEKYSFASFQNIYSPGGAAEPAGATDLAAAEGAEGPATTETKNNIIATE